jgi:hypothetical protein
LLFTSTRTPKAVPALTSLASSNDPEAGIAEKALAHVVRGVLDLVGLKLDAEGRLLG